MAGGLIDILDALEYAVQRAGEKAIEQVNEHWYNANAAFNAGQVTIFEMNISWVLEEWSESTYEEWPWTDSGYYEDAMWSSYDLEVLDRAFSDTISEPSSNFDEIAYQAQEWQEMIDFIRAILGF